MQKCIREDEAGPLGFYLLSWMISRIKLTNLAFQGLVRPLPHRNELVEEAPKLDQGLARPHGAPWMSPPWAPCMPHHAPSLARAYSTTCASCGRVATRCHALAFLGNPQIFEGLAMRTLAGT
jgi:hypothetical protein